MTAQDIKNSILQLAVQGKLVPQDPNDEPTSELLKRIKAEKQKLIKEGKIKKDKIQSEIYFDADNIPYEKRGSETVCIKDEFPFEIPQGWVWSRLGSIANIYTGNSINETEKATKYTNLPEGRNFIATKDVNFDCSICYNNGVKIPESESKFRVAPEKTILLCIEGGSAGRKIGITQEEVCFGNKLCAFIPYIMKNEFLFYFLQTSVFTSIFKSNVNGIIGGVSINKIKEIIIPLPPLEEQKRIVAKIEELLPHIDEYGKCEAELNKLNKNFPEALKKSILQTAVQDRLVPQDPNDESAESSWKRYEPKGKS